MEARTVNVGLNQTHNKSQREREMSVFRLHSFWSDSYAGYDPENTFSTPLPPPPPPPIPNPNPTHGKVGGRERGEGPGASRMYESSAVTVSITINKLRLLTLVTILSRRFRPHVPLFPYIPPTPTLPIKKIKRRVGEGGGSASVSDMSSAFTVSITIHIRLLRWLQS